MPSTSLLPLPPADGVDLNDEKPLLHVFFDVEVMQDTGRHVPNLFNTLSNQSYVGRIPDTSYFMPDVMSVSARGDFEAWHTRQCAANVIYDFQKDLTEYCKSDIKLLKQGCLSFKSVFEPLACFNPFSHITIASACNWDLRQNRMEAA